MAQQYRRCTWLRKCRNPRSCSRENLKNRFRRRPSRHRAKRRNTRRRARKEDRSWYVLRQKTASAWRKLVSLRRNRAVAIVRNDRIRRATLRRRTMSAIAAARKPITGLMIVICRRFQDRRRLITCVIVAIAKGIGLKIAKRSGRSVWCTTAARRRCTSAIAAAAAVIG